MTTLSYPTLPCFIDSRFKQYAGGDAAKTTKNTASARTPKRITPFAYRESRMITPPHQMDVFEACFLDHRVGANTERCV